MCFPPNFWRLHLWYLYSISTDARKTQRKFAGKFLSGRWKMGTNRTHTIRWEADWYRVAAATSKLLLTMLNGVFHGRLPWLGLHRGGTENIDLYIWSAIPSSWSRRQYSITNFLNGTGLRTLLYSSFQEETPAGKVTMLGYAASLPRLLLPPCQRRTNSSTPSVFRRWATPLPPLARCFFLT